MDEAGVAKAGRGAHIVNRQSNGQLAAVVPDREVTAPADAGDGPAVAVLTHSVAVSRRRRSLARVMITSPMLPWFPSAKDTSDAAGGVIEPMRPGTAVEFGDQVAGGVDHDRVEPSCSVGNPSAEGILSGGGEVADMNAAVIKVEVEPRRMAVAEGE
jgi:hypothetical protein